MTDLKERALGVLSIITARRAEYDAINRNVKALQGDFATLLQMMDVDVERAIIGTLDAILGDELASYYLYEARSMRGGGFIREADGREWPIRTIEDVRAYAMRSPAQLEDKNA